MPQLHILHQQVKFPVSEMSYILYSVCPMGRQRNHQKLQAITKTIGSSLQTDGKALLFMTLVTYIM